jgi:branched-chain amino acid transport system ATP-binding protein
MSALLKLDGVTADYGAAQALFGVDLEIGVGELVALMGRNGMGKPTTVRTICSLIRPRQGAITFAGSPTRGLAIHRTACLGICRIPEGRRCLASLTVEENTTAPARPAGPGPSRRWRSSSRVPRSGSARPPTPSRAATSKCSPSAAP